MIRERIMREDMVRAVLETACARLVFCSLTRARDFVHCGCARVGDSKRLRWRTSCRRSGLTNVRRARSDGSVVRFEAWGNVDMAELERSGSGQPLRRPLPARSTERASRGAIWKSCRT